MGLQGFDVSAVSFAVLGGGGAAPAVLAGIDSANNPSGRLLISQNLATTWTALRQGVPADLVISAIAAGPASPPTPSTGPWAGAGC